MAEYSHKTRAIDDRIRNLEEKVSKLQKANEHFQEVISGDNGNALAFQDRIIQGEIIGAVYVLLGHTSSTRNSKTETCRKLRRNFPFVFSFVRNRNPNIDEETLQRMLLIIDPAKENPYISERNHTAHNVSIQEAQKSAARHQKDGEPLQKWLDLLTASEKDVSKFISDVAFKDRMYMDSDVYEKPITDLKSLTSHIKAASEEELDEFSDLLTRLTLRKASNFDDLLSFEC